MKKINKEKREEFSDTKWRRKAERKDCWKPASNQRGETSKKRENSREKDNEKKETKNKAGYTAVRCVPRVICSLALAPSLITPPLHPVPCPCSSLLITSFCHTASPAVSIVEKTGFRVSKKNRVTDGPTDGPTDGRANGRMDRHTYKGLSLSIQNDSNKRNETDFKFTITMSVISYRFEPLHDFSSAWKNRLSLADTQWQLRWTP